MANTLTNVSETMLQDEVLPALKLGLTPLNAFSIVTPSTPVTVGDVVRVPVVGSMTAGAYTTTFATGDSTITTASVTIGAPTFRSWYVNPNSEGIPTAERFLAAGREAAYAVAKLCVQDVLALFVEANIGSTEGTDELVCTAANYNYSKQVTLWQYLKTKGVTGPVSAIHTVAYAASLLDDSALYDKSSSGADIIQTGELPPILGARQFYTDAFPTAVTNQNTGVIYTGKSTAAVCIGAPAKIDQSLESQAGVREVLVTDPDTGLSFVWRTWVEANTGVYWGSVYVCQGEAFVQNAAVRAVSA